MERIYQEMRLGRNFEGTVGRNDQNAPHDRLACGTHPNAFSIRTNELQLKVVRFAGFHGPLECFLNDRRMMPSSILFKRRNDFWVKSQFS